MTEFAEELASVIFAAIASAIALAVGWKKGFFQITGPEKPSHPPTILLVLIVFGIYFGVGMFVPALFSKALTLARTKETQMEIMTLASFSVSLSIMAALSFFSVLIAKPIRRTIFLRSSLFEPEKDLYAAAAALLISYPLVLFIGGSFDLLLYFIYGTFNLPDQIAVLFLKMTFENPGYFALAMSTIVVFAPLIEETLFRGYLQSWLRRFLPPFPSIAIASLLFTTFHYSATQGASNVTILSSLFILGCFLGFLYEKRRSLLSPIFLHALFNMLNAANLYFSSAP